MNCFIIMDDTAYANETASSSIIAAIGIHMISGGKPPISRRVNALNSFVLPVHEVDVSHAPILGLCPYGDYSSRLSGSFCQCSIYNQK